MVTVTPSQIKAISPHHHLLKLQKRLLLSRSDLLSLRFLDLWVLASVSRLS